MAQSRRHRQDIPVQVRAITSGGGLPYTALQHPPIPSTMRTAAQSSLVVVDSHHQTPA